MFDHETRQEQKLRTRNRKAQRTEKVRAQFAPTSV